MLMKKVADDCRREAKRNATLTSLPQAHSSSVNASDVDEAKAAIQATKLFGTNGEVAQLNRAELAKLPGPEYHFEAFDTGSQPYLRQLQNGTKFPEKLSLKEGAQVKFILSDK
jgi:hypothetical protein